MDNYRQSQYRLCLIGFLALAVVGLFVDSARAQRGPKPASWEKTIAAFERQDSEKPPPTDATLFVGSSSIRFWDLSKSFPGLITINRGFGGSQLADSVFFSLRGLSSSTVPVSSCSMLATTISPSARVPSKWPPTSGISSKSSTPNCRKPRSCSACVLAKGAIFWYKPARSQRWQDRLPRSGRLH